MFKILDQLNLTKLFLLAILLRVLIMPFYFHPDIKTTYFKVSFLKMGVIDIYSYLDKNVNSLKIKENLNYLPLTYFSMGAYYTIVSNLLGDDFSSWLKDASVEATTRLNTFRYLFILKLPYLILDLIIPFLLIKFLHTDSRKRNAFILWLFNPLTISIIYIFSNIDVIPVTLSLISLLYFQREKFIKSGIMLALAIGFKAYPILFLPFLALSIRDYKKITLMIFITFGLTIAIIIPFWSTAFVNSALLSSLTTRLAFPGIGIGFGESLMIGIVVLTILFLDILLNKGQKVNQAWYYLATMLLLVFSTIHYHIQWLLWILPFLILLNVLRTSLTKLLWTWAGLAFLIPLLYDDKSMSVSLLSAISLLYNLLPTPFLIIQHIYDPFILQGVIHSILLGISLVLVFKDFKSLEYE